MKRNLLVWSIIVGVTFLFAFAFFAGREFLRAQTQEDASAPNVALQPGEMRIISTTTNEDASKRSEWKREYIVEKTIERADPDTGEVKQEKIQSKLVEVGSGLNYLDNGELKPSNPHFIETAAGFELIESTYKLTFGKNLAE